VPCTKTYEKRGLQAGQAHIVRVYGVDDVRELVRKRVLLLGRVWGS